MKRIIYVILILALLIGGAAAALGLTTSEEATGTLPAVSVKNPLVFEKPSVTQIIAGRPNFSSLDTGEMKFRLIAEVHDGELFTFIIPIVNQGIATIANAQVSLTFQDAFVDVVGSGVIENIVAISESEWVFEMNSAANGLTSDPDDGLSVTVYLTGEGTTVCP
jgi:hypothetical protein